MVIVIGSSTHTARKPHRCDSCLRVIEAGTEYNRARCVDGGEAWTWKSHPACQKAGQILSDRDIQSDDGCLINVCDMESEEREIVYAADPETFHAVWPECPVPGKPEAVK